MTAGVARPAALSIAADRSSIHGSLDSNSGTNHTSTNTSNIITTSSSGGSGSSSSGDGSSNGSGSGSSSSSKTTGRLGRIAALIQQHGSGAVLAYLTLSNLISCTALALGWALFVRATGQSPLAPGAWPKFALSYAPLYCAVHAARPARLAAGLALAPAGDALLAWLQRRMRVARAAAFGAAMVAEGVLLLAGLGLVVLLAGGSR